MLNKQNFSFYLTILLLIVLSSCKPTGNNNDYLVLFVDTLNDSYGYKNPQGEIAIQAGKYEMCFTDTFKEYAMVLKPSVGFVAIDKKENVLYKVFSIDNGPDYFSDGMFRIIENDLIGYADAATGKIIIKPQFKCAFPFEEDKAKVSMECVSKLEGEHSIWESNTWYYIDKTGKKINTP